MEIDICYKSGPWRGEPVVKHFLEYHCYCPSFTGWGNWDTEKLSKFFMIMQLVVGRVKAVC